MESPPTPDPDRPTASDTDALRAIRVLKAENRCLKVELATLRGKLFKAYKSRAEIHARLRSLTFKP